MASSLPLTISTRPRSERSGGLPLASERAPDLPGCEPFPMTEDMEWGFKALVSMWVKDANAAPGRDEWL